MVRNSKYSCSIDLTYFETWFILSKKEMVVTNNEATFSKNTVKK